MIQVKAQNYISSMKERTCTPPIFFLLIYILFTFFPLIYTYLPILGQMKIVLIAGIFLFLSYMGSRGNYTNRTAYKSSIYISWICFISLMCLGLLTSMDRGATVELIKGNFKYLLVFLVMINVIDTAKRLDLVLAVFTACGAGMALGSIYTYFFSPQKLLGGYRAIALDSGVFGDPNDLALLLNSALPFAIYFLLKRKNKIVPAFIILIIIIAIVLTFSRGGFLGLCITGLGLSLFFRNNRKYVALVLTAAIAFWLLAPASYKERISTINSWEVDKRTGMTNTRMDAWRIVLNEGLNNWALGAGAGSSWYLSGKSINDWHSIHNTFIQVLVEMGVFAFICYLLLFIHPFREYKRIRWRTREQANPDLAQFKIILISLMSYGVTVFFLPQAYSPILYILTGFSLIHSQLIAKTASPVAAG